MQSQISSKKSRGKKDRTKDSQVNSLFVQLVCSERNIVVTTSVRCMCLCACVVCACVHPDTCMSEPLVHLGMDFKIT